jgi:hypothetical protein
MKYEVYGRAYGSHRYEHVVTLSSSWTLAAFIASLFEWRKWEAVKISDGKRTMEIRMKEQ